LVPNHNQCIEANAKDIRNTKSPDKSEPNALCKKKLVYFNLKAAKAKRPMIITLCTLVPPKKLLLLIFNKSILFVFI